MTKLEKNLVALEDMASSELVDQWTQVVGTEAPKVAPHLLKGLLAQHLQEKRFGKVPALVLRELKRLAASDDPGAAPRRNIPISAGTRLVREWNGQTIVVDVVEDGFQYAGQKWNSLSKIARHVTGTHWSGPRFFGLTAYG